MFPAIRGGQGKRTLARPGHRRGPQGHRQQPLLPQAGGKFQGSAIVRHRTGTNRVGSRGIEAGLRQPPAKFSASS